MPGVSDSILSAIAQSERDGGVWLKDLHDGDAAVIRTRNNVYRVKRIGDTFTIEGHPRYCPTPVLCRVNGSTWGGSMIKAGFIGIGMHLECWFNGETLTTSPIASVEVIRG